VIGYSRPNPDGTNPPETPHLGFPSMWSNAPGSDT
jgi:hypothetical protein